jgi:hypothetical protein
MIATWRLQGDPVPAATRLDDIADRKNLLRADNKILMLVDPGG